MPTSTIYAPIHLSKVKMFLIVGREGERNNSIWNELMSHQSIIVRSLSKPRRRRQRERRETKGLMSKTMAVHVRHDPLYISMASSA